jgi:hypothetical protein
MSGELGTVGSLQDAMTRLWALEATIHPSLHVYKWWRPDMQLPALFNWLTPGDVRGEGVPACKTVDTLRITVIIAVDPTAVMGEGDMLELAAYFDFTVGVLDRELYSRHPLGQRMARRRGAQTVADELGDVAVLTLEFPIEVELHHDLTTP